MTEATATLEIVSGPHRSIATVRYCDTGGERLRGDEHWWLVRHPTRNWVGGAGASCAAHCGLNAVAIQLRPRRASRYNDALESAAERRSEVTP